MSTQPKNQELEKLSTEAQDDVYTAKMDRMVNTLKKNSKAQHKQQMVSMLAWSGVGFLIVALAIYLMLNVDMNGFQDAFNFLK